MKCKKCGGPTEGYKCAECGAEMGKKSVGHECGGKMCQPKCKTCGEAEGNCVCNPKSKK